MSNIYNKSKYFVKTSAFTNSAQFSDIDDTNLFTESSKFSRSEKFTSSDQFSQSYMFSAIATSSPSASSVALTIMNNEATSSINETMVISHENAEAKIGHGVSVGVYVGVIVALIVIIIIILLIIFLVRRYKSKKSDNEYSDEIEIETEDVSSMDYPSGFTDSLTQDDPLWRSTFDNQIMEIAGDGDGQTIDFNYEEAFIFPRKVE